MHRPDISDRRFITHADGSGGVGFFTSVCLSVCLSDFLHTISKTDAASIAKLGSEMFHHMSWKRIYFGVRRSKVKVTSHKNIAGVSVCTLASAGFF